ncbi:MAG: hypothetical protein ACOH1Q_10955 [Thiobacillus sp.]
MGSLHEYHLDYLILYILIPQHLSTVGLAAMVGIGTAAAAIHDVAVRQAHRAGMRAAMTAKVKIGQMDEQDLNIPTSAWRPPMVWSR